MATGRVFDPMTLLRVTPLVSSTAAIWFSGDQYLFMSSFIAPHHRQRANGVASSYFRTFFPKGAAMIVAVYSISIISGGVNCWRWPNTAAPWYAAGAGFALAHFVFVPPIMERVKAIYREDIGKSKETAADNLQSWINVHMVRSLLADLPAWICFGIASIGSLQPAE